MVWTLAGGRIDEATERWILWKLPLERALQYYHCALRQADAWTVPPGKRKRIRAELERMDQLIAAEEANEDFDEHDDDAGDDEDVALFGFSAVVSGDGGDSAMPDAAVDEL